MDKFTEEEIFEIEKAFRWLDNCIDALSRYMSEYDIPERSDMSNIKYYLEAARKKLKDNY